MGQILAYVVSPPVLLKRLDLGWAACGNHIHYRRRLIGRLGTYDAQSR